MTTTTFTGKLLTKIQHGPDTTSYFFSRPGDYSFEAGQYFGIVVPSADGPLQHLFSHADSPTEDHTRLTTRLTGSPFKNALDALELGDEATFNGPAGRFVFDYSTPKLVFLAGGIGITPIRSMLRYLADTGGEGRVQGQELALLYGSMTENEILYQEELDELAEAIPGLRVVHVITEPSEKWSGHRGFITAEVVRAELGEVTDWTYYIVGPPAMISAMDKVTGTLQIEEEQIVKESFAGYSS